MSKVGSQRQEYTCFLSYGAILWHDAKFKKSLLESGH